jgi:hypothetical protein
MVVAVGLLTIPACAGGGGASAWLTREPGRPATRIPLKEPLPTTPVPAVAQPDFAENRTINGPGQRLATHKAPEVKLEIPEEDPPRIAMDDPESQATMERELAPPPLKVVKEEPLMAAVRAYLDHKPEQAVEHLKDLDRPNQDLMLQLIPALVRASQTNFANLNPHDAGMLAGQFESVANTFARRASLTIEKTAFCRSVKNFGHYEPLPANTRFKPGEICILYVELGNVPCMPTVQNGVEGYLTRLNCTLQLRDTNEKVLELTDRNGQQTSELAENKVDFSRSPLKDYFMLFWFAAPSKPGRYVVNFKVRDPNTGREISKSEPFFVGLP